MYEMKKRCPICNGVIVAKKVNRICEYSGITYQWRAECINGCFYTKLFVEKIFRDDDGILKCEPDGFNKLVKFWEEGV